MRCEANKRATLRQKLTLVNIRVRLLPEMPPQNPSKRYHHGDLRRALLDATLALAADRGAGGVTLREAARVARVSQTAPYRHFADKQAMLAAAAEEGFRLLSRTIREALSEPETDARAQVLAFGATYVRFALEHPSHFRLMYGHGSPPKSATPELQHAARDVYELCSRTIGRFLSARPSDQAVKEMVFRLWALAHGVAALALERQLLFDVGTEHLIEQARAAMAAQLDAVRPTARANLRGPRRKALGKPRSDAL
jgi:AcrR family transcriptional regulator